MAGMSDYAYAAKLRDVIRRIVVQEIDKNRPSYKYATVVSIDRPNRKCVVNFPGYSDNITIWMGSVQPTVAGQIVRVAGIGADRFVDDVMGPIAWTDWVPVIGGTGWAFGNAVIVARYVVFGTTVHFRFQCTWGSTSTFGTGPLTVTLPLVREGSNGPSMFVARALQAGTTQYALQAAVGAGLSSMGFRSLLASTSTGIITQPNVINTVPFTWVSGDSIQANGTYETT